MNINIITPFFITIQLFFKSSQLILRGIFLQLLSHRLSF
jgi:hypothetical protein